MILNSISHLPKVGSKIKEIQRTNVTSLCIWFEDGTYIDFYMAEDLDKYPEFEKGE
jgi:hypothetical protein